MTLSAVAGAIANVISTRSTLVRTAIDPPPPVIQPSDLPCCYILTSDAQDGEGNDSQYRDSQYDLERRIFLVRVAVIQSGMGTPHIRESTVRPILDEVKGLLRGAPTLLDCPWVSKALVRGDSGIARLPDWDGDYIGFDVELIVWTYHSINYLEV